MLGTDITPEMSRAKELKPITSKQLYENDAKANLVNTNIPAGRKTNLIKKRIMPVCFINLS